MLFKVPGAKSSPGLPGIVTRPGFTGCLYCLWLPRVRARNQPSSSSCLRISRTFMGEPAFDDLGGKISHPGRAMRLKPDQTILILQGSLHLSREVLMSRPSFLRSVIRQSICAKPRDFRPLDPERPSSSSVQCFVLRRWDSAASISFRLANSRVPKRRLATSIITSFSCSVLIRTVLTSRKNPPGENRVQDTGSSAVSVFPLATICSNPSRYVG